MKIVIDIDGTIIYSIEMLINIYNKFNEDKLIYNQNHNWDLYPIVKNDKERKELFKYFDYKDFYNNPLFTYGARDVINKLSKKHEVIICSKHNESRKPVTTKFINECFPNCKLIFVDDFEDKCLIPCDMIIDDKIECIKKSLAKFKICFGNYDWNKNWDGSRYTNWNDIEQLVRIMDIIVEGDNKYEI